ncbi:GTP cyclohydrolase II [Granulicella sp. 5B5]|nr:GTP cyclohydrolase II [Granulicella sp. 5B5]
MQTTKEADVETPLFSLKMIAEVNMPTRWANFRMLGFEAVRQQENSGRRYTETALVLILGDIHVAPPIVRIHSQCATGDIFHSLRCDCHDQLHLALRTIADEGAGILLYEHQEGRGIGLMEKLRAYALQDQGLDTIEANLQLGHAVDTRDFQLPVRILQFLQISSLRLMTNNPQKIATIQSAGIKLVERVAADVASSPHAAGYLATKREKLGHIYAGHTPANAVGCELNPVYSLAK